MTPEAKAFALAALEEALTSLQTLNLCRHCEEFEGEPLDKIKLAIREAIEQIEGKAAPCND